MNKVIALLAQAGATGAAADVSAVATGGRDAAALAEALAVARHLACMVFTPDNEPAPLDAPARPDEEEPATPDSQAA